MSLLNQVARDILQKLPSGGEIGPEELIDEKNPHQATTFFA
jgi:hypothetical protein